MTKKFACESSASTLFACWWKMPANSCAKTLLWSQFMLDTLYLDSPKKPNSDGEWEMTPPELSSFESMTSLDN